MARDDLLQELVHRAVEGDNQALARFVDSTQSDVWRLCAALGRAGDVEDLVQETYVRALTGLERFRGDSSARAWLLRIARNVCADLVRSRQRDRDLLDRLRGPVHPVSPTEHLGIRLLLDSLPSAQREAFVVTQMLGMSYDDAAVVLECPIGTVRSRVSRARAVLVRLHEAAG